MRLIAFDMDGTLVDSAALAVESVEAAFAGVGLAAPDEKTIRSISGLNLGIGLRMIAPDVDEPTIEALVAYYRAAYLENATKAMREPLFDGALEVLERLHAREDTFLVIATGKALRGAQRVLNTHEIADYFVSVNTPDNFASKPDPDMLYAAMRRVGTTAEQTVMIGDTYHDMRMAKAAGVKALGVSWGYHTTQELIENGAHRVIDSYTDMEAALDELLEVDHA